MSPYQRFHSSAKSIWWPDGHLFLWVENINSTPPSQPMQPFQRELPPSHLNTSNIPPHTPSTPSTSYHSQKCLASCILVSLFSFFFCFLFFVPWVVVYKYSNKEVIYPENMSTSAYPNTLSTFFLQWKMVKTKHVKLNLLTLTYHGSKTGHSESDCHVENHAYQSTFAPVSG